MRAVAYLRVSTQDQSTTRQKEDIEKYAEDNKLKLVKVFEDKISGSKKDKKQRIGFKSMFHLFIIKLSINCRVSKSVSTELLF
jgi:DNA invertase Pin-like site-specific DNA recombinase|tara:strand:+ start:73 stop:321 length:249 start_codon:yes stop_codon:yes gene_type:complete